MPGKLFFVMCCCFQILLFRGTGLAQSAVIFPVFANTEPATGCTSREPNPWHSRFTILNSSSAENAVTFTAYDSNGAVQDSTSLKLKPFTMNGDYTGPRGIGWVKVASSQPLVVNEVLGLSIGCSLTSLTVGDVFLSKADLSGAVASRRHIVNIEFLPTALRNTGVSIVFPSAGGVSTKGKLIHRWIDGELVSETDVVIPPNGQLIGLISELLPPASFRSLPPTAILGSLEITFDHDVFVTALRLNLRDVDKSLSSQIPE